MKSKLRDCLCLALIILAGGILYYRSLSYQLTYLDDNVWLIDYKWYLKDASNLLRVFIKPDLLFGGLFYRPLIYFSFIVDTLINPTSLVVYRITNLILHCFNACFIYILLRKLKYDQLIVAWFSLIFVIHPVLTQAVVWIPGRTDSLLAFCVLLSFISFVCYLDSNRWSFIISHFVFLLLSLLTKETAIVVPLVSFLYIFLFSHQRTSKIKVLVLSFLWVVVVIGFFILRRFILQDMSRISPTLAISSMINNLPAVIGYLGKIFFPVNLSVLPILKDIKLIYGWVALGVLLIVFVIRLRKTGLRVLYGALWFLLFLLPSLVASFLKHEYRVYIPLVGIFIVVLELNVLQVLYKKHQKLSIILGGMVLLLLSSITWNYIPQYKDRYVFWENAVTTSPHSPLAHRNLGAMYFLDKKYSQAEEEFLKALKLNPRERMVYNNLGLIYELRGDQEKAERAYLNEAAINPRYDTVYYNLGLFYGKQGQYKEAVKMWEKAVAINPRNLHARKYLAVYYSKKKMTDSAQDHLDTLKRSGVIIPEPIDDLLK